MASNDSSIITRIVTVKPKTTQHQYSGTGSGLGYYLDDIESPLLTLISGKTYRFKQDDSSNASHQLRFYATADRATPYTANVTTVGTAGSPGAYTEISVTDATPVNLHYQCVNHAYMGNGTQLDSTVVATPDSTPAYSITPSTRQVNEGDSLSTTLSGFTPNSTLFFRVTGRGINKKDFSAGAVKGRVRVDGSGVATISHTLRADKKTEGDESFSVQVFSDKKMRNLLGQSDAVTVFDTSMKAGKRPKNNTVAGENSNNSDNARTYRDIGSLAVRAGTKGVDRITGQGGEIVYGGAKKDVLTGLSKISNNGEWIIPSFLSGGLGNDQYIVTQGAFVVIMDAGGGKDTVSAPSMNINNIEFIRINQRDIYATDGNTSVLLVDPQGLQGDQYKLENFVIGKNRYSLAQLTKIAEQSSYFGGDYTYSQLQSLGGLNLSEVGMNPLKINDYMTDALFNNSIV